MIASPRELRLSAPAKLNLFLHVVGRRPDGYHELQTLFRLVDLCDDVLVQVAPAASDSVCLAEHSDGPRIGNLIERAARAWLAALPVGSRPAVAVTVAVRKRIPQGGLGGGSSDAAAVLLGLDALLGQPLGIDGLAALGRDLGADVPVFVRGRNAWAEGVGEQLTAVDVPEASYVIVAPGVEVPTAAVFGHPSLTRNTPLIRMRGSLESGTRNDCETLVRRLYPEVDRAIGWLSHQALVRALAGSPPRLTGTGGCVFAECPTHAAAEALAAAVPAPWQGYAVRGVARSPVHAVLDTKQGLAS